MNSERIYSSAAFFQPAEGEPIRSIITESPEAVVVAWYLKPGQLIAAHLHPHGQDTWTILAGQGEYVLEASGASRSIQAGDVVLAHTGCVHGVYNNGVEPLLFISVVTPGEAGYELVASRP
ncbi:MAG: cupin domain-containing protein [Burkholderiaceae bacterium]